MSDATSLELARHTAALLDRAAAGEIITITKSRSRRPRAILGPPIHDGPDLATALSGLLLEACQRWRDLFHPADVDAIARIRATLATIAEYPPPERNTP